MKQFYQATDIPTNQNGAPQGEEYKRLIKNRLEAQPCPIDSCQAKEREECSGVKHIHIRRVPDEWDSLLFVLDYLNGFDYIPGRYRTSEYLKFWSSD